MVRVNFVIFELMRYEGTLVFWSVKQMGKKCQIQIYLFEFATFCVLYKILRHIQSSLLYKL